jgi:hypothetical protein
MKKQYLSRSFHIIDIRQEVTQKKWRYYSFNKHCIYEFLIQRTTYVLKKFIPPQDREIHNTWGEWEKQTSPPMFFSQFPTLFASLGMVIQKISCVLHWLPTAATRVRSQSGHVGFVVDEVALGQVSSEYFRLPLPILIPSSGAGTISQLVADVPSGLSLTPPHETK